MLYTWFALYFTFTIFALYVVTSSPYRSPSHFMNSSSHQTHQVLLFYINYYYFVAQSNECDIFGYLMIVTPSNSQDKD